MFCTVCTITLCYVIYILYCACALVKNSSDYHVVCWVETRGESSLIFSEDTTRRSYMYIGAAICK